MFKFSFSTLIYLIINCLQIFGESLESANPKLSAKKHNYYELLNTLPYERFVSLGNCCVTRTQINLHLSKRFHMDAYSFGGGQLFDWLIIHDYNKFAKALENGLMDLFNRSDLLLIYSLNGLPYSAIRNCRYEMTWNHLFTRELNQSYSPNIIDIEYGIKKTKIDYLSEKFKLLKYYRTLYIIAYPYVGAGELETKELDRKVIKRIRNALLKMRGNANFSVLFCPLIKTFDDFDNIKVRTIVNSANPPHLGDFGCWDRMLSEFPFTLTK